MCMYRTDMGRGSVGLNIERLVSGWSEGMEFTPEPVMIECVKTGSYDMVSD